MIRFPRVVSKTWQFTPTVHWHYPSFQNVYWSYFIVQLYPMKQTTECTNLVVVQKVKKKNLHIECALQRSRCLVRNVAGPTAAEHNAAVTCRPDACIKHEPRMSQSLHLCEPWGRRAPSLHAYCGRCKKLITSRARTQGTHTSKLLFLKMLPEKQELCLDLYLFVRLQRHGKNMRTDVFFL